MSKKESLASIRALRKHAIHLRLTNANLSCKGSKEEMARWLHQHLSAQSTPTSSGQHQSRAARQRTSSTIKKKKPSLYGHQPTPNTRVATTTSQQPPSRPLTRRTERQLVEDEDAEDPSGDDSDDYRRRHPRINSNGHQRLPRTRRRHGQAQLARQVAPSRPILFPTPTTQLRHTVPPPARHLGVQRRRD